MNNNLSELVVKTIDNMKFNTIYDCSKDIYTINITMSDELYNNKSEYRVNQITDHIKNIIKISTKHLTEEKFIVNINTP
jgi:hypothetical protein